MESRLIRPYVSRITRASEEAYRNNDSERIKWGSGVGETEELAGAFGPASQVPNYFPTRSKLAASVVCLEKELQGKLDDARVHGGLVDLAKVRRVYVRQEQRAANRKRARRISKLSVVERVVELGAELQHFAL
jgi:hypothetical protein